MASLQVIHKPSNSSTEFQYFGNCFSIVFFSSFSSWSGKAGSSLKPLTVYWKRIFNSVRYCDLRDCVNVCYVNTCLNLVTNWIQCYMSDWIFEKKRSLEDTLCSMWMNCLFVTRVASSAFSPLTTPHHWISNVYTYVISNNRIFI